MFPYLDLPGFKRRSVMPPTDVDALDSLYPGFVAARVALASSFINSRLRKRYGTSTHLQQSSLPLGQNPPTLLAAGTTPPAVTLFGRPIIGSVQIRIEITTLGALGVAVFRWSMDGGLTFVSGVTTAASVALTGTGLSALFSSGSYSTDNVYSAATPVPESVLGWLTAMVTRDLYLRRGMNPQDPAIEIMGEQYSQALLDLKEASDSKDGLFDLPVSEDQDSAVTTGGPLSYSETSPYVWQNAQRNIARGEDDQSGQDGFESVQ
jgi:hypothetical protein